MLHIPFSQMRANLADTLHSVEAIDEPVVNTRRGAPTAILMSVAQFRRLAGSTRGFAERLDEWRRQHLEDAEHSVAAAATDRWANVRDTRMRRDAEW